jgi:hypothetical protein
MKSKKGIKYDNGRLDYKTLDDACIDCSDFLNHKCVECSDCPVNRLKLRIKKLHPKHNVVNHG